MTDSFDHRHHIIEAALFAAGEPLMVERLQRLFAEAERPTVAEVKDILEKLMHANADRGIELVKVGSGYRYQAKSELAPYLQRLWEKKPPKYTRALLETLALIVYRQPITRGEIEEVRGVAVSTNIMKVLQDRNWVKVIGHKDVPGKPALFGTTKQFLDYFNLKSLSELPALPDVVNLEALEEKLNAQMKLAVDASAEAAADTEAADTETPAPAVEQEELQPEAEEVA